MIETNEGEAHEDDRSVGERAEPGGVGIDGLEDSAPSAGGPVGETRCGFVALIGAPNAGKSTLINQAVGTKVSIVSRKVQTTRSLVRGIALSGLSQIIFVDTPGIFAPRRRLDRAMVSTAWGGAGDADVVALLVDARKGLDDETAAILEGARQGRRVQGADPKQERHGRDGKSSLPC